MADEAGLVTLEEQFWKGDASFYEDHLAPEALMVFGGPAGVLRRPQIVASIRDSARWRDVDLSDVTTLPLAAGATLLTYRASAAREGDAARYTAMVTSVYVRNGTRWQLAFHQQTPLADDART